MLNLVCRDTSLRQKVMGTLREVFSRVFSRPIEGEVNDVLFCLRETGKDKDTGVPAELQKAAKSLQGAMRAHCQGGPSSPHIDIAAMLKDLRIA